jgi:hypothetical protein
LVPDLVLAVLNKRYSDKMGPGPEPGSVAPSKKSGSASTVLLSDGDGFNITGAKLDVQRLDLVVLGGDDLTATISL